MGRQAGCVEATAAAAAGHPPPSKQLVCFIFNAAEHSNPTHRCTRSSWLLLDAAGPRAAKGREKAAGRAGRWLIRPGERCEWQGPTEGPAGGIPTDGDAHAALLRMWPPLAAPADGSPKPHPALRSPGSNGQQHHNCQRSNVSAADWRAHHHRLKLCMRTAGSTALMQYCLLPCQGRPGPDCQKLIVWHLSFHPHTDVENCVGGCCL